MKKIIAITLGVGILCVAFAFSALGWLYCDEESWI